MNEEKTTIFIDTQDMEERYGEELYKEYLEKENQQLKEMHETMTKYALENEVKIDKLQQENEQLKQANVKLISENNKLQHHCYSSIEYIDQVIMYKPCAREIDKELDNLIGILRGKYDE